MMGLYSHPVTRVSVFEVQDLSDADYGTALLSNGVATSPTAIDLSSVASAGDLVDLLIWAANLSTTARTCELFVDSGGTKHKFIWSGLDQGVSANSQMASVRIRVGADPAATLYYSWSSAPAQGCSVWAQFVTPARCIRWL